MTILIVPDEPSAEWAPLMRAALPGHEVRVWPDIGDPEAVRHALVWRPPRGFFAGLPNLQAVFVLGAGIDGLVDEPSLRPDLPLVRLIDPGMIQGMVEYVVLHCLAWHRNLFAYRTLAAEERWHPLPERLAPERRVGVLGLGRLGAAAARALAALGFVVAGWSRGPKYLPDVASFRGEGGLRPFLARTDLLVNLLPLTAETHGILSERLFAAMPRGGVLINAGRGSHLVEADLLAALDSGRLAGATLDVFEEEPLPPGHPFWRHERIVVTPHVASATLPRTAVPIIAANIRRFEAEEPMDGVVDRARGY